MCVHFCLWTKDKTKSSFDRRDLGTVVAVVVSEEEEQEQFVWDVDTWIL